MATLPVLYEGSVKDLRGPIQIGKESCIVFDYTDAYSVFDWGRMPDLLPHKGEALATIAADWFEKIEKPETWQEFSRSQTALSLRKGNRFGAAFIETGEILQKTGLKTHYRGVLTSGETPRLLGSVNEPPRCLVVSQVSAVRPRAVPILGRSVPDYIPTRESAPPRLIPLEVVFRFSCPDGSSLFDRVAKDPLYLSTIGFPDCRMGEKWDFPVLEIFTKLESSDRPLSLSEALAISGISGSSLQEVLYKTAWVAGLLKSICAKAGLELADGKLEWGVGPRGEIFLVDAIGPDELRLLTRDGIQLSKEFLRLHYRSTHWFEAIQKGKSAAKAKGVSDWKQLVSTNPDALPPEQRELASQLYRALTNSLTGKKWFPTAWPMDQVVAELTRATRGAS